MSLVNFAPTSGQVKLSEMISSTYDEALTVYPATNETYAPIFSSVDLLKASLPEVAVDVERHFDGDVRNGADLYEGFPLAAFSVMCEAQALKDADSLADRMRALDELNYNIRQLVSFKADDVTTEETETV